MVNSLKRNFALIFFCTIGLAAWSHPHIWIDSDVTLHWEESGVRWMDVHWTFDNIFSRQILFDYDENKNGGLEKNEIAQIQESAFSNLQHFNYFLYLNHRRQQVEVQKVENFHAYLDGEGALVYTFRIYLAKAVAQGFVLSMLDETNFVALQIQNLRHTPESRGYLEPEQVYLDTGLVTVPGYRFN